MSTVAVPTKDIEPVLKSGKAPVDGNVIAWAPAILPILPKPPRITAPAGCTSAEADRTQTGDDGFILTFRHSSLASQVAEGLGARGARLSMLLWTAHSLCGSLWRTSSVAAHKARQS
jgi:hypothetical protein